MNNKWGVRPPPKRAVPPPNLKWRLDFFGDETLNFQFTHDKSFWQRMWCSLIFGSKWHRL
jgi:hypothetical protein